MSLYYSLRKALLLSEMVYLFKIKDACPISCWRSIAPWVRKDLTDLSGGRFTVTKNKNTVNYYFAKIGERVKQDFSTMMTVDFLKMVAFNK